MPNCFFTILSIHEFLILGTDNHFLCPFLLYYILLKKSAFSSMPFGVSALETFFRINEYPIAHVLPILLKDRTTGRNIIWATGSYTALGEYYRDSG